jgi:hypothetical protein
MREIAANGALGRLAAVFAAGMACVGCVGCLASTASAATGVPNRNADPVVLKGSDIAGLIGVEPSFVVAFSYDDGWEQIPVQVDERAVIDYPTVRQFNQTSGRPFTHEAYTDPGTFAGADPDPTLDAGDEIAMMAKDAGASADAAESPAGVDQATRTEVAVSDPLDATSSRFIYLFKTNAGLDPSAGESYVDYNFSLDSGAYKTTYDFTHPDDSSTGGGPHNPENSTVTTPFYSQHLLARWITDGLTVTAGDSTDVDILDGDKAQVSRGCGRYEGTFSRGGGGFIVNKSGPVRAIRSYIGANSGTYTQRDDIYYQRRQDTFTYLRVHEGIAQISQYMDYSTNALGMTYRDSVHPTGVPIDGVPDPSIAVIPATGLQPMNTWQQTTGPQGSLSTITRVDTNMPGFTPGSFYRDQGSGPFDFTQCAGYADAFSYGSSGTEFKSQGKNTDPSLDGNYAYPHYDLTAARSIFYGAPFVDATAAANSAAQRSDQVDSPLTATANAEPEPTVPELTLSTKGPKGPVEPGRSARFKVKVRNTGEDVATDVAICPSGRKRQVTVGDCKGTDALADGESLSKFFKVELGEKARRSVKVKFKVTAEGLQTTTESAKIKIANKKH